ncbi:hypothetical protein [Sulfuricystis multivorans]|uniref:hypothetical protein n=1 Tax=Sulfuricystis multivorans TaxID=2211108 RepID=UPI000F829E89|nr:hypothetical protein [Sulfuricystis multivorans]
MISRIRTAYYGIDHAGRATVMVSNEYHDTDRPGWIQSTTQRFISARDIDQARAIASCLKTSGKVDLIKPL